MTKQTIAANVRRLREEHGWSQDVLAQKVGISRSAMNQIENARVDPAFGTVQAIADEFGVALGVLTGDQHDNLSADALKIARRFDELDVGERMVMKDVFWRYVGTPPSGR